MAVCGEHCENCVYVGEGDFSCLLTQKLVIEDFCPTDLYGVCDFVYVVSKKEQAKERLDYAKKLLAENNVEFKVCNEDNAHIQVKADNGKILNFWARTGKIQGKDERGIKNFIKFIKENK